MSSSELVSINRENIVTLVDESIINVDYCIFYVNVSVIYVDENINHVVVSILYARSGCGFCWSFIERLKTIQQRVRYSNDVYLNNYMQSI